MLAPQLHAQTCTIPKAKTVDVVDDYHGTKVADPYRWLEDVDSPETRAWVAAENCVTFAFLEKIPERKAIEQRLTAVWNYAKYGVPFKEGGRYFFSKNDGLQNQSVLYTQPNLAQQPAVLLDPNTLLETGAGDPSGCSGPLVHVGSGAGDGFKSDVVYAADGSRVAVLLLNGKTPGETGYARAATAANSLYCAG